MTREQLDEIEKLAEAAPLGEWPEDEHWGGEDGFCAQGPYHGCPHGGHRNARDVDACNEVLSAAAVADQAFLKKMAESALPLVKALREAREDAREQREDALAWMQASFAFQKERDEARAEIERLKAVLRLLWEEAQDKCAIRDDTTEAVEAALKEGE